ncbi:hypothetical protein EDB81DRAFT_783015, partial [Dactylonectria macrodidyma]
MSDEAGEARTRGSWTSSTSGIYAEQEKQKMKRTMGSRKQMNNAIVGGSRRRTAHEGLREGGWDGPQEMRDEQRRGTRTKPEPHATPASSGWRLMLEATTLSPPAGGPRKQPHGPSGLRLAGPCKLQACSGKSGQSWPVMAREARFDCGDSLSATGAGVMRPCPMRQAPHLLLATRSQSRWCSGPLGQGVLHRRRLDLTTSMSRCLLYVVLALFEASLGYSSRNETMAVGTTAGSGNSLSAEPACPAVSI